MLILINEILSTLPFCFYYYSFHQLEKEEKWIELPLMVKLVFLDNYIENYSDTDKIRISEWINEKQSTENFNLPKKIAKRIVDVVFYMADCVQHGEYEKRIDIIKTARESLLKDLINEKDENVIRIVDLYLKKKIEIIEDSKENAVFDDREEILKSICYFIELSNNREESKHALRLYKKNLQNSNEIPLDIFLKVYIELPNLNESDVDKLVPFSFQQIKDEFKRFLVGKSINYKKLKDFNHTLENLKYDVEKSIDTIKLEKVHPNNHYKLERNSMLINYFRKKANGLNVFINYIETDFIKNRTKLVFPNRFEDTILDKKRFNNILKELKIRNLIREKDGKYFWCKKHNELTLLLKKLADAKILDLEKFPLNGNYSNYGKLICPFFNYKCSERSISPSRISNNDNLFSFIISL